MQPNQTISASNRRLLHNVVVQEAIYRQNENLLRMMVMTVAQGRFNSKNGALSPEARRERQFGRAKNCPKRPRISGDRHSKMIRIRQSFRVEA
jgi:hypothetical protein